MTPPIKGPKPRVIVPIPTPRSEAPKATSAAPEPASEGPAAPRPSAAARADASRRFANDPLARYLEESLRQQGWQAPQPQPQPAPNTPPPLGGGAPKGGIGGPKGGVGAPKGGTAPKGNVGAPKGNVGSIPAFGDQAKAEAKKALDAEGKPDPKHPYVADKAETKDKLTKLGALEKGDARLHIADTDWAHGAGVTRTAAGKTSLAEGADTSLTANRDFSDALAEKTLSKGQIERRKASADLGKKHDPAKAGVDDHVKLIGNELEDMLVDKQLRIAQIRDDLPKPADGKKTIVNMSWGQSADRLATRAALEMIAAADGDKNSTAHAEVVKALGREPKVEEMGWLKKRVDSKDIDELKEKLIFPKLKTELESKEYQARIKEARDGVAAQAAAGRKEGVLVFQAAGNEHESAARAGDASMSENFAAGIPGIITVGATDNGKTGKADDKIAALSAAGKIDLSAPGVKIPVGENGAEVDGTSLASPIAAETAYAMAAANPKLSVDEIAKLMKDPRALDDIKGTDRDGAGQIDQFAAVLLAKNPKLTRKQIDQARDALDEPNADVEKIKKQLGI